MPYCALYIIMMPGNIDTIIEMPMLAVPTLKKNKTEKGFSSYALIELFWSDLTFKQQIPRFTALQVLQRYF